MSTSVVVGAGPSGLTTANFLAEHGRVLVVDRLPVVGGESGWRSPDVRRLVDVAQERGVSFRLGVTALRWEPGRLLVAGPGACEWLETDQLFYAGGIRPGTATDLGLVGDRPGGVLPATVADHLLETGVPMWRRPVIIGRGRWRDRLIQHLSKYGTCAREVLMDDEKTSSCGSATMCTGPIEVRGGDRVTSIVVTTGSEHVVIRCDAVLLAGRPQPNRNVEGAVLDSSPGVSFVQPRKGITATDREAEALKICQTWHSRVPEREEISR